MFWAYLISPLQLVVLYPFTLAILRKKLGYAVIPVGVDGQMKQPMKLWDAVVVDTGDKADVFATIS